MAQRENRGQESTEHVIALMTERIVARFHPLKVILFGSHARREAGVDSDVDLLVVFSQLEDAHRTAVEIRRTLRGFGVAKDIVVTTTEEITQRGHLIGTVLEPALREGRVLYERA